MSTESTSYTISCIQEHLMHYLLHLRASNVCYIQGISLNSFTQGWTIQFSKMLMRKLHSKQRQQCNLSEKEWCNPNEKQWYDLNENNGAIWAKAMMQSGIETIWMNATLERKLTTLSLKHPKPRLKFMQNIQVTLCKMQYSSKKSSYLLNTMQDARCHAKHSKSMNTMQDTIFFKGSCYIQSIMLNARHLAKHAKCTTPYKM